MLKKVSPNGKCLRRLPRCSIKISVMLINKCDYYVCLPLITIIRLVKYVEEYQKFSRLLVINCYLLSIEYIETLLWQIARVKIAIIARAIITQCETGTRMLVVVTIARAMILLYITLATSNVANIYIYVSISYTYAYINMTHVRICIYIYTYVCIYIYICNEIYKRVNNHKKREI